MSIYSRVRLERDNNTKIWNAAAQTMADPLKHNFPSQEAKMSNGLKQQMTHLNHIFQNCKPFRNRHPNMIQNEHVYAICCRPEVAGDVIYGEDVQTFRYFVCVCVNLWAASFSSFQEHRNQPFNVMRRRRQVTLPIEISSLYSYSTSIHTTDLSCTVFAQCTSLTDGQTPWS